MSTLSTIAAGALQVLKTVAPTIADTLAGPFAPLVDPIMKRLFGASDAKTVETGLLTATPDQLLALRKEDDAHAEQLEQLGITRDKLSFDDIANARAMAIATHDRTPKYLAYFITVGFFGVLGYLVANGKPPAGGDVLLVLMGSLGTAWTGIISYYFGSSAGSASKTDTINKIAAAK